MEGTKTVVLKSVFGTLRSVNLSTAWKTPLWSQLVLLPHFQQLPDFGLPCFQLGNVVCIEMPGAVDAAADLVDVCSDPADGGSQLFLLGVVHFDDVAVDQHLAGLCAEVVGSQLAHFVLDEIQFLLVQADFLSDGSCAIRHGLPPQQFHGNGGHAGMVVANDHGGSPFGFDKIWLKDGLKHSSAFHNPSDRKVEKVRRRQKRIFQSPSLFPTDNFFEIGGKMQKIFFCKAKCLLKNPFTRQRTK